MSLNQGVFLDLGSVDNDDLDLGPLRRALPELRCFGQTRPGEVAMRIAGAEVAISNKVVLDRDALVAGAGLRLVLVAATGANNVDLGAARELGIAVCNCRDYATAAVTQHTLALILNLVTGQMFYRDRVRAGDWCEAAHFSLFDRPIQEVRKLNLGIVGHGVLGASVAEAARCLGMEVLLAERRGRKPRADRHAFDDVLRYADVISIHCPLTPETHKLFDRGVIARMKPTAYLVNTARGGIVNEADLADCLREGVIAGAGIDVLSEEPPLRDHPLLAPDVPHLIVTPHNAWASRAARQALVDQLARLVYAFERGQPLHRIA